MIHGHGAKGGAYARLAMPGRRVVRAYTPHGGSLLLRHDNWSGRLYLTLERMLLARRTLFLFESAYSCEVFREKIGEPNGIVRIIHNGVSKAEFEPADVTPDATDLVFIGEFRPVKGIDILIDAIAALHRRNPRGDRNAGRRRSGRGDAARAGRAAVAAARHAFHFGDARAQARMTLGRVMVIPSRAESLPYVVLETAAASKPLITTSVGGIPEIFGPLSGCSGAGRRCRSASRCDHALLSDPAAAIALAPTCATRVALFFSVDAMVEGIFCRLSPGDGAARAGAGRALATK